MTDWNTADAWVKGGHSGQVFVYGQGWVDPPESPEVALRASVSTWLTQAIEGKGRLLVGDLVALRDWIDGGHTGDAPKPKWRA